MKRLSAFVALIVLVSANTVSAQVVVPFSWRDAARSAGENVYMDHCSVCHAWRADMPVKMGPSLVGIVGRPAASQPGFPYSAALKNSGIVWTEDNLKKWLADNAHMVPDTLMPHVSITDPAEQIYLIEYLKTLKVPSGSTAP
ncbi:MAG TPA: c-type cytochrome [Rhizomicrobium sp.]|nr:c-type cytochrome [Rhizomicrobium sp.]